jgi:hypothetical protein
LFPDFLFQVVDRQVVVTLSDLLLLGSKEPDDKLDAEMRAQRPGDVCLVLYTVNSFEGLRYRLHLLA